MKYPSVAQLKTQLEELATQMSDPNNQRDRSIMTRLSDEHTQAKTLLEVVEKIEKVKNELSDANEFLKSDDADLKSMAADDIEKLNAEDDKLTNELQELLLPRDPRDKRNVIVEIRAGAGGDEAGLFARELFRSYSRYAEENGWRMHVLSQSQNEQGGFKEIIAEIEGQRVFGVLKFESGVHRVQRVPETEKQGRIHTSTVTVAVLPEAEEVDIEIKTEDLRIDTYRASGAGGQHVNKTDSAIRITHLPTDTVVAVQDERSQFKNKTKAMSILRARLLDAQVEATRSQAAEDRKSQVGTGDRSEKIRTYNFPQDRITDHRINKSWGNIEGVMAGAIGGIFVALQEAERELLLEKATK